MSEEGFPEAIRDDIERARRLEYWTLAWMGSVVVVMGLAMGSSQAMRSAWLEDLLSLIPAIVFLVALRFECRGEEEKFRYGYRRLNSLAFLVSAVALSAMGAFLLFEAGKNLLAGEHPTIGSVTLFGQTLWLGWLMIVALIYSVVPPVLLGRMKLPIAERIQDKVLHTDALMQKADWMTGLAGIVGILGVGLGFWWADSAAAGFISLGILRDGIQNLRMATSELIDGMPRELASNDIAEDARKLERQIRDQYGDVDIRMRESGRYILVQIEGLDPAAWQGLEAHALPQREWRLDRVSLACPIAAAEARSGQPHTEDRERR